MAAEGSEGRGAVSFSGWASARVGVIADSWNGMSYGMVFLGADTGNAGHIFGQTFDYGGSNFAWAEPATDRVLLVLRKVGTTVQVLIARADGTLVRSAVSAAGPQLADLEYFALGSTHAEGSQGATMDVYAAGLFGRALSDQEVTDLGAFQLSAVRTPYQMSAAAWWDGRRHSSFDSSRRLWTDRIQRRQLLRAGGLDDTRQPYATTLAGRPMVRMPFCYMDCVDPLLPGIFQGGTLYVRGYTSAAQTAREMTLVTLGNLVPSGGMISVARYLSKASFQSQGSGATLGAEASRDFAVPGPFRAAVANTNGTMDCYFNGTAVVTGACVEGSGAILRINGGPTFDAPASDTCDDNGFGDVVLFTNKLERFDLIELDDYLVNLDAELPDPGGTRVVRTFPGGLGIASVDFGDDDD